MPRLQQKEYMNENDEQQLEALRAILRTHKKLAIAFSGGVDSTFLLHVAVETLGAGNVLAITAEAENFPEWEAKEAAEFIRSIKAKRILLSFDPLSVPEFAANIPERCYFCKRAIFEAAIETAKREGYPVLADGTNADDTGDYRPGLRAVRELAVASPLFEAGLDKAAIRRLAHSMGLAIWDKPSFACLASRFIHGEPITSEKLRRVEQAEAWFLERGIRNIRVRSHGDVARIEVDPGERKAFYNDAFMDEADRTLRGMGFSHVALDMAGYRTGSMNNICTTK